MTTQQNNEPQKGLRPKAWKAARWGIIIFCFIHFLFEVGTGNEQTMLISVVANYVISAWYIKRRIKKYKLMNRPMLAGFTVSCIVFLIRLFIGIIYTNMII